MSSACLVNLPIPTIAHTQRNRTPIDRLRPFNERNTHTRWVWVLLSR